MSQDCNGWRRRKIKARPADHLNLGDLAGDDTGNREHRIVGVIGGLELVGRQACATDGGQAGRQRCQQLVRITD